MLTPHRVQEMIKELQALDKQINILFFLKAEALKFQSETHLFNFTNYLFSQSKAHKINEDNIKNTFFYNENYKQAYNLTNPKQALDYFKKTFQTESENYKQLKTDLYYPFFALTVNNITVTNLFYKKDNKIIPKITPEDEKSIIYYIYDQDSEKYLQNIQTIKNSNFQDFDNLKDLNIRNEIEKIINKQILKEKNEHKVLFSISHNDQDTMYYIHSIIKQF